MVKWKRRSCIICTVYDMKKVGKNNSTTNRLPESWILLVSLWWKTIIQKWKVAWSMHNEHHKTIICLCNKHEKQWYHFIMNITKQCYACITNITELWYPCIINIIKQWYACIINITKQWYACIIMNIAKQWYDCTINKFSFPLLGAVYGQ